MDERHQWRSESIRQFAIATLQLIEECPGGRLDRGQEGTSIQLRDEAAQQRISLAAG